MTRYRRFLRISLRALFVLTTLVALWLGYISRQARLQRAAVERIHELGGSVRYDYQFDADGKLIKDAPLPGWPWLRELIGDEYFQEVVWVNLHQTNTTDRDLQIIGQGTHNLRSLNLGETNISGEGLKRLGELSSLELLSLNKTAVDSEGFLQLGDLSQLKLLILDETQVDDTIVPRLLELSHLEIMQINNTSISGAGLIALKSELSDGLLSQAEILHLDGSALFDEAVSAPRRQRVFDRFQALSDEGRLKALDVSDTHFGDEHVPLLYGLADLEAIDVRNTRVTENGLELLRDELPDAAIFYGQ